jgi:transcription factor TFIIIB component B''
VKGKGKEKEKEPDSISQDGHGSDPPSGASDVDDPDATLHSPKRRKVSSTSSAAPRKKRKTPPPPYDPSADPGEELDPTTITMSVLCDDMGRGRVSQRAMEIQNNHLAWKANQRAKRLEQREKMERKKRGEKEELQDGDSAATAAQSALSTALAQQDNDSPNVTDRDDDGDGTGFDYTQGSKYSVQIRIGANGKMILDEDSLTVERAEQHDTEAHATVIESDRTRFTNSGSYSKRPRGSRWSEEETDRFFDVSFFFMFLHYYKLSVRSQALAQYGENYELIALVLPGRDRKACKNKFKAEDKKNPAKINHYLKIRLPMGMYTSPWCQRSWSDSLVDIKALSASTGKDFSGPTPEIKALSVAPILPTAEVSDLSPEGRPSTVRKRSASAKLPKEAEEGITILGSIDDYEDD